MPCLGGQVGQEPDDRWRTTDDHLTPKLDGNPQTCTITLELGRSRA